jgi:hypothetical protein
MLNVRETTNLESRVEIWYFWALFGYPIEFKMGAKKGHIIFF